MHEVHGVLFISPRPFLSYGRLIKTLAISLHSWNTPFTPFCSTGSPGVTFPSSLPAHGYWSVYWNRTLPIPEIPLIVIKILPEALAIDRTQQATVPLTSNAQCKLYCTSHVESPNPFSRRIRLSPCQWLCSLYSLACWGRFDGSGHNDGHLLSLDTGDLFCRSIAEWLREDLHLLDHLLAHVRQLVLVCVRSYLLVYGGNVQWRRWEMEGGFNSSNLCLLLL